MTTYACVVCMLILSIIGWLLLGLTVKGVGANTNKTQAMKSVEKKTWHIIIAILCHLFSLFIGFYAVLLTK